MKYLQAKTAEAQRKKQTQTVLKMQADLEQLQRVNARKLKVSTGCVGVPYDVLRAWESASCEGVRLCVWECVYVGVCQYACEWGGVSVCMWVRVCTCGCEGGVHVSESTYMWMWRRVHVDVRVYACEWGCVHVDVRVQVCMWVRACTCGCESGCEGGVHVSEDVYMWTWGYKCARTIDKWEVLVGVVSKATVYFNISMVLYLLLWWCVCCYGNMLFQEAAMQAQQVETELHQKIIRETAELTKVQDLANQRTAFCSKAGNTCRSR